MRRRDLLKLVGGSAAAWPLGLHAQQGGRLLTIGFLGNDATAWSPYVAAFVERLHQLGWVEGRTIAIEYRWSEGHADRVAEVAAEFVRLKVDVIVTVGTAAARIKRATAAIPIIFAISIDPVGSGLVASLAHPGGNITGLSVQSAEVASKRLELLREAVPSLHRLAVIINVGAPETALERGQVEAAARTLGIELTLLEIRQAADITPVFEMLKGQADALYAVVDALVASNRTSIITLALGARLPTMFNHRDHAKAGGFMSYGPNYPALFQRTAELVDKVLRGKKPNDIPVEQPTKFNLVINLTTAKALGLNVPQSLLATADEVIE